MGKNESAGFQISREPQASEGLALGFTANLQRLGWL
jgi:hypothetical protein